MSRRRFIAICIAVVFLLTSFAYANAQQIGTDVSGFSSVTISGTPISGSVFGNYRASVVCYFATWSQECLDQLALLQRVHRSHPEYGVFGLLCLESTSTAEAALEYMTSHGYTFTVFVCDSIWQGVVDQSMFIPQSFFVSNEGVIVEAWQAAFQWIGIIEERLAYWGQLAYADGDADLNGIVNSADALYVLRCSMAIVEYNIIAVFHGDINGNNYLDTADALLILRMII